MVFHAVTVALEDYGVAVHDPAGIEVGVSVIGDVDELACGGVDEGYVIVGVALVHVDCSHEPFAVGRPVERYAAVAGCIGLALGEQFHLLALKVGHGYLVAVLYEHHTLAVGRNLRVLARHIVIGREERLLVDEGSVGKVGVFLACYGSLVYIKVSVAVGGVVDSAVVSAPRGSALGLGGVGDLASGGILYRGHEEVAVADKRHLLAVGRRHGLGGSAQAAAYGLVYVVGHDVDFHLGGFAPLVAHGVDLTVVAESQGAVGTAREESHGVGLEFGHGCHLGGVGEGEGIHVEAAAVALAQIVDGLTVTSEHRVACLAGMFGEIGVLAGLGVIHPHVASHRRGVVFAPLVLGAFVILIEKRLAVGHELHAVGRSAEYLAGASALDGHAVELTHAR